MLVHQRVILQLVLENEFVDAKQGLSLDELVELDAQRRFTGDRQVGVIDAPRLANADVPECEPVERERAGHAFVGANGNLADVLGRDDDVNASKGTCEL